MKLPWACVVIYFGTCTLKVRVKDKCTFHLLQMICVSSQLTARLLFATIHQHFTGTSPTLQRHFEHQHVLNTAPTLNEHFANTPWTLHIH